MKYCFGNLSSIVAWLGRLQLFLQWNHCRNSRGISFACVIETFRKVLEVSMLRRIFVVLKKIDKKKILTWGLLGMVLSYENNGDWRLSPNLDWFLRRLGEQRDTGSNSVTVENTSDRKSSAVKYARRDANVVNKNTVHCEIEPPFFNDLLEPIAF